MQKFASYYKWRPHFSHSSHKKSATFGYCRRNKNKELLHWQGKKNVGRIIFPKEKLYCTEQYYNVKKMMSYIQQHSEICLKLSEMLRTFRTRILLWCGIKCQSMENCHCNSSINSNKIIVEDHRQNVLDNIYWNMVTGFMPLTKRIIKKR